MYENLRSKCHGAKVEFIPLIIARTTYSGYHVPYCYRAECLKCGYPTEVEEKEEVDAPNPICKKCKYWVSMPVGCTLDDECPHNPFIKEANHDR